MNIPVSQTVNSNEKNKVPRYLNMPVIKKKFYFAYNFSNIVFLFFFQEKNSELKQKQKHLSTAKIPSIQNMVILLIKL